MTRKINRLLKKICKKLFSNGFFSFGGSMDYSVTVKLFESNFNNQQDNVNLIENALGSEVEVENIERSNIDEVLNKVKECFKYQGDEGFYPNKEYVSSEEFQLDLEKLLENMKELFSADSEFFKFCIKFDSHPFYPVYWEYAFLIKKKESSFVLVDSSSD